VVQACNPIRSGARHEKDWGLKPAQENSSWDPI
jgi:hypothetical protein